MADNGQSRIARRKQKKTKKKPLWKRIFLIVGIIVLAMVIGIGGTFTYFIATAPKLDAAKLQDAFSSKIYDKNGDLFADMGSEKRTRVSYDDLPQVLIDAVTATEDARFFKHHGIDLKRVGGAVVGNITNGFGSQGASTLTQQLAEKSFLSHEKKIGLKVQEMWLALKIERKYSKEEILEMYLNKVYYGSGAYGVAKASQIYFGKTDLKDLTLPEAAILAGLPQRPTAYNPKQHPDLTKDRMKTVLHLMVKHGKITKEQADKALDTDIKSLLTDKVPESKTPYEAFLQKVRKEVKDKLNADIYTDGLKIYTTLDPDIQEHVELLLSDDDNNPINYPEKVEDPNTHEMVDLQAGAVVLDTQNGAIRAIGGGRGLENDGFNYALQINRQGGSTMKPVLAYGPAIENENWSTYHQINDDKPYQYPGTDKKAGNWNGQYQGWITMRKALAESLNVPALKTAEEIGSAKAQKFGEDLGLDFGDNNMTVGDAIGGGSFTTNPLEIATAFRAFANEGVSSDSYSVTKVEYPNGRTVKLKPKQKPVISDYTAYMITDMLKTVMSSGTGEMANIPGLPVAGKTGTTNKTDVEDSPDSWFTGYSTNYTISIWTGYDNDNIGISDTKVPLAIFKDTMSYISKNIDTKDFKQPNSVVEMGVENGSNPARLPSSNTPDSQVITELFVKGNEPSKQSVKFDKLDPVSNLAANYDNDGKKIKINWDYNGDKDVSYRVSASVDGGDMKELSTTKDKSMEISKVDPGSEYKIQVVAVSGDETSDAKTTTVKVPGGDDNDDDEDKNEDMKPVSGLNASYNNGTIDVSWKYDGPAAAFEVNVTSDNGASQQQTVNSNGIKIDNAKEGSTYTIAVTPIGKNGDTEGERGDTQRTTVTIPGEENDSPADEDNQADDNTDQQSDDQEEQGQTEEQDQPQDDEDNNDHQDENDQNQDEEQDQDQSDGDNQTDE